MKKITLSKALALFFVLFFYLSTGWAQTTIFEEAVPTFTELPTDWTGVNVGGQVDIVQTSTGGYLLVDDAGDYVETKEYDLSAYSNITLNLDVATYGSGDAQPLLIEVSNDGGATWTHETFTSATPSSSTYIAGGPFSITADATNVKFRFSRESADGRGVRFRNILLEGELPPFTTLFESKPDYFGDRTERGIVADANSIYVASRNGGVSVQVHDRNTGAVTGTLNTSTGITGGTFPANDIEITDDGLILLGNLGIGDASAFKLYILDDTDNPVEFVNYPLSELGGGSKAR